ncbi:MAG: hypothetical protein ACOZIN_22535 [Myxococcota bacterium]
MQRIGFLSKRSTLSVRELKDKAHKLLSKGKVGAATELYRQLIGVERKDPALRLRHAELCQRLGKLDEAVASFRVAAHLLAEAGHLPRARAALRLALEACPEDAGVLRALDELQPQQAAPVARAPSPIAESIDTVDSDVVQLVSDPLGDPSDAPTELFCPFPEVLTTSHRARRAKPGRAHAAR